MIQAGLFWWIVAGLLLGAELLTGTFYLLMIALGCVVAGMAHVAGAPVAGQLVVGAAVALAAVIVLRRSRFGKRARPAAHLSRDVNQDIGARLQVPAWQAGRARVRYRGADWDVELGAGESDAAEWYEIREVRGSRLIVAAASRA